MCGLKNKSDMVCSSSKVEWKLTFQFALTNG